MRLDVFPLISERSVGYGFLMRARVANYYPTSPFHTVSPGTSVNKGKKRRAEAARDPALLIVLGGVTQAAAIAFGFGAQNVARDIVERAYERRRDEVRSEAAEREESTARGDSVPRTRPLRSDLHDTQ